MQIIKLDAIDSTNSFLRQLIAKQTVEDYTVVIANHQTKGRGQMGANWYSEESKNLMVSMFKDVFSLNIEQNFYISMVVSLSILKALELFQIKNLRIKWPNDILSDNKKIAGILIENVIKQNQLQASVIGFGINVNQTEFDNLPKASSLKLITGTVFELDEILQEVLNQLKRYFQRLEAGPLKSLKDEYEDNLFRKDKPSTFVEPNGELFTGVIKGITDSGHLLVLTENTLVRQFDLKEITLLY